MDNIKILDRLEIIDNLQRISALDDLECSYSLPVSRRKFLKYLSALSATAASIPFSFPQPAQANPFLALLLRSVVIGFFVGMAEELGRQYIQSKTGGGISGQAYAAEQQPMVMNSKIVSSAESVSAQAIWVKGNSQWVSKNNSNKLDIHIINNSRSLVHADFYLTLCDSESGRQEWKSGYKKLIAPPYYNDVITLYKDFRDPQCDVGIKQISPIIEHPEIKSSNPGVVVVAEYRELFQ